MVMLARQAWRLLQNPDSLSARILKSIYYRDSSILEAVLGNHPSQIWRAMIEGRDTLKLGLIKRIGSGQDTRIWEDQWLPRGEMMRPYGCVSQNPPMLVSELIDPTSAKWNIQKVNEVFMPMDVKVILEIPLCTRNIPDFWSWFFDKKGNFIVLQHITCLGQSGKEGKPGSRGLPARLTRPKRRSGNCCGRRRSSEK